MYDQFLSLSRTLLIAGTFAGMALASNTLQAQNDPPPGSARLAHLQGNVSFQPDGSDSWGEADNNMPVGSGDRVYTDQGRGELQAAQVRAYFGPGADLTLVNLNYQGVELGLAQGSANIFNDGFGSGQEFSVQTPNGAITIAGRAAFRIDVYPDEQSTVITNARDFGGILLNGAGGYQFTLRPGESVQLTGTNPVYTQPLEPAPMDGLARWSTDFEVARRNSISARYVSPEMEGYDELDNNGDWQPESDYGPIWFPRVEAGWAPYHNGHWVNRPFYGWTWVADEPWGAAPFHYGRWVQMRGRWGWIPGPREQHPVWSPAQVVFAAGVHIGGAGVSVWFPLGPGEAYKPWYPCTPQYIDRVNVTNIRESRVVHVQKTYVNVVNITNVTNVTYVNRTTAVTAVRQQDFAAGRSVKTIAIKVDPHQVEHVQVGHPDAPAPSRPMIQRPVAKPVAVQAARPVLINHQGQQAAAAPNAKPVAVPVKAAPPAPKPIPGRAPIGAPTIAGRPAPAAPVNPGTPKPLPPSTPAANRPAPATPATPLSPRSTRQPDNPALTRPPAPVERPAPDGVSPAPGRPAPVTPPTPRAAPQPANPPAPNPRPANPHSANPGQVNPGSPNITKPLPPAPAERPLPTHPPTITPAPRPAPGTIKPPANPPAPRTPPPTPATRPQPVPPEARPTRQAPEKPAPAAKDDRKNDKKKDERKAPPPKPE